MEAWRAPGPAGLNFFGQIPAGTAGTRETLKQMRALVWQGKMLPEIRDLANAIVADVAPKDFGAQIEAVFHWVRDHIRYSLDTNEVEVLQRADQTLARGFGDCDDMSILLATLLECLGNRCVFCALGFGEAIEFSHVIVLAQAAGAGAWLSLDATEPNPVGWFPPGSTCGMIAELS